MDRHRERKEALFEAARQLTSRAEQAAYLAEACGQDLELRAQVEAMLEDEAGAAEFFRAIDALGDSVRELAAGAGTQPVSQGLEGPGTVIDRYRLLEQIGEGGFGIVYLAEQREPVARQVALKIIKPGLDTREVVERFEAERRALARMEHPNIARVLDGGTTQMGRPYFVMDLVRGTSLSQFGDGNRLSLRARLELFIKVCQAVQHAHQKGIIHRDLKPSNVMVAPPEPGHPPGPKVIDFGIAKALDQQLTARTLVTRRDQLMGTPEYMSPEQAEGNGVDVDTRSDIYSLGAMLYELLTGTPPFARETLKRSSLEEIRLMLRETEPPRPSTRLRTLGARATEVARQRRIGPVVLTRLLRGDLDWVVMKALEKDRTRRYETAAALAQDLERYLNHEPVTARPPSRFYRCQKFARRNKLAVAASTAVLLALGIGLTLALLGIAQSRRERNRTQTQAAVAQAISDFLQNDLLLQSSPYDSESYGTNRSEVKLTTVLDRASEKIEGRFPDQPLVEASIRFTLGRCYLSVADAKEAERHLKRALEIYEREQGPDAPETLEVRQALGFGLLFHCQNKPDQAIPIIRQVLEVRRRVMGPRDPQTLDSMQALANVYWNIGETSEAERLWQDGLAISREVLGNVPDQLVDWLEGLAWVKRVKGENAEAGKLLGEVYQIYTRERGPNHPSTLQAGDVLAGHLIHRAEDFSAAEPLVRDLVARCRSELGADHEITLQTESELAHLLREKRFLGEAERLFGEVAERSRKIHGPDTPDSLALPVIVGSFYSAYGYDAAAEDQFRPAYDRMREVLGAKHDYVLQTLGPLVALDLAQARFDEAEQHRRELLDLIGQSQGPGSPRWLRCAEELGSLYGRLGRWDACADAYAEVTRYDTNNMVAFTMRLVPSWLAGKSEEARSLMRECLSRWGDTADRGIAREIARAGLLLAPESPELGPVLPRADLPAITETDPWQTQWLKGMALYRQGKAEASLETLSGLLPGRDAAVTSLAGCFFAMAHHQLGQPEAARQALAEASSQLASVTRSGDLADRWFVCAVALIARAEAETVILGQTASPPINASSLAAARIAWNPIRSLLEGGEQSARRRQWEAAGGAFRDAMRKELFDWNAAEIQDPFLRSKIALVLLMADDVDGYAEICRPALERATGDDASPSDQTALRAALIGWPYHLQQVQQQAIAFADSIALDEAIQRPAYWAGLGRGMAEYRAGHHDEAFRLLDRAQTSYNQTCATAALAFRAMTEQSLGQAQQAREDLKGAKETLMRLQDCPFGDLGSLWLDVVLCELAVKEATETIFNPRPASRPGTPDLAKPDPLSQ